MDVRLFKELDKNLRQRMLFKIASLTFNSVADGATSNKITTTIPNGRKWLILELYHNQDIANPNTALNFQGDLPIPENLPLATLNQFKLRFPFLMAVSGNLVATLINNEGSTLSVTVYMPVIEVEDLFFREHGALSYLNEILKSYHN